MKTIILIAVLFLTQNSFSKQQKKHRHHEAHIHGAAKLGIVFDGLQGQIDFRGAAEGILSFEHKPKTKQDEKKVSDTKKIFVGDIAKMIEFDSKLKCKIVNQFVEQVPEEGEKNLSEHSEWSATYKVACEQSPVGTKIKFNFSLFPGLNDVDVSVIADSFQKSFEIKKPTNIDLK